MTKQNDEANAHNNVAKQRGVKRLKMVEVNEKRMQVGKHRDQRHGAEGF